MSRNFGLPNPEDPLKGMPEYWADKPPENGPWWLLILIVFGTVTILISMLAYALGHDAENPGLDAWYTSIQQPDTWPNPVSCCGTADAYWADEEHVVPGLYGEPHIVIIVTDDRDDTKLHRYHVPIGTKYEVPEKKIVGRKQKVGNPTGHAILFLSGGMINGGDPPPERRQVLCYVPNEGL